jgi:hypothetical protein
MIAAFLFVQVLKLNADSCGEGIYPRSAAQQS